MIESQRLGEIFSLYCMPYWTIWNFFLSCIYNCFCNKNENKMYCSLLELCSFGCLVSFASKVSFHFFIYHFPSGFMSKIASVQPFIPLPSEFMASSLNIYHHEHSVLLSSVVSFFSPWWMRALWKRMVWFIQPSLKATKDLPHCC